MAYKHCYNVLLSNDYVTFGWYKIWAYNKDDVYNVCARRYPDRYVEFIRYIK